jgi:beta-N-acetylhexosaminidase
VPGQGSVAGPAVQPGPARASPARVFWRILIPLVAPGLVATSIFSFITAWNEFIFALTFLGNDQSKFTLPIYVQFFFARGTADWGQSWRPRRFHDPGDGVLPVRAAPHGGRPGRRGGEGMIRDPELARLADAVLIPPFPGHTPPAWILAALEGGLAGVTLFGPNVADPEQIALLTATLRAATEEPVIAIDEEGGDVTRVTYWRGSPYPGNAALGAIDDVELTGRVHEAIGADLAALGINVDLAPCVDVLDEAENPAIGTRSFGTDPALVSRHAAAAVTGLQSAGVAACAKHFPGHGSTRTDTHEVLAVITGDMAELRRRDLPPFQAAIGAGVAAVMPGHLRLPELTGDLPASLSAAAMTGLLRGELGFTGAIISDALEMRAVSGPFGIPEAAVLAVTAGVDLLCLGRDTSEEMYHAVVAALADAVRAGRLPGQRLEDAADRVAGLRVWLAPARASAGAGRRDTAGLTGEHIGLQAARRAVRRYGQAPQLTDPVIVEVEPRGNVAAGRAAWGLAPWAPPGGVRRISAAPLAVVTIDTAGTGSGPGKDAGTATAHAGLAEAYADGAPAEAGTAAEVLAAAANRSLVLVVRDAHRTESTQDLVLSVLAHRPDAVVVEMGLPVWQPPAGSYRTFVATYGASRANGQAAAEVLGLISRLTGGAGRWPWLAGWRLQHPVAARSSPWAALRTAD